MNLNSVTLTYFRPSGSYYGEGTYKTTKTLVYDIFKEVAQMIENGYNPGLVDWAVKNSEYFVLVVPDDSIQGAHPCLLTPERCKLLLQ